MEETLNTHKKWQICDGFTLKIIAIITMTLDHIAVVSTYFGLSSIVFEIFMAIGRLSLPLFCFLIVEGVLHTKSFKNYALRLGIMAIIISTSIALCGYIPSLGLEQVKSFGNIFLDLLLGAFAIFALRQDGYKKLLAIIPLVLVSLSFAAGKYEIISGAEVYWYPFFLRTQYDFLSFGLILLFYASYLLKDLFFKYQTSREGTTPDLYNGTDYERLVVNLISLGFLVSIALLFHFFGDVLSIRYYDTQIYCLFAGAFILLYNGKRGYNSKYFQYAGYIYYPVHILIIGLVFYLLFI